MPPHVGRGGWTWYTGAAGWMYRVSVEAVLGLKVEGTTLRDCAVNSESVARVHGDADASRRHTPPHRGAATQMA